MNARSGTSTGPSTGPSKGPLKGRTSRDAPGLAEGESKGSRPAAAGPASPGDRSTGDRVARLRRSQERAKARGKTQERPKRESSPWARIGLLTLGGALIAIGVAGLVLPGIQGVITILAGLVVVSLGSRTAHRWSRRRLRRWPRILDRYERMRHALRRRFRRREDGGSSVS